MAPKESYRWQLFIVMQNVVFFLPFLNLGPKMKSPQNWYTDFQSAIDQPLDHVRSQLETRNQKYFTTKFAFFFLYKFADIKVVNC